MRKLIAILSILTSHFMFTPSRAQLVGDMDDESKLYAESKQVNQFFRRFNGEEDEKGNRYYPGDKRYRSNRIRKKYLGVVFDENNPGLTKDLKSEFTKDILDKSETAVLDFHSPGWFSEVRAQFLIDGKPQPVTLFMELEKDHLGSKWVISRIHVSAYDPYFVRDTTKVGRFLHPMSHELEFMNLRKALANTDSISQFTVKKFVPDHLTLFLYDLRKGNIKFQSVEEVKFHFFQIDGWYFEVANFNRPGYNTGWLVSSLVKLNSSSDRELMRKHILYESQ